MLYAVRYARFWSIDFSDNYIVRNVVAPLIQTALCETCVYRLSASECAFSTNKNLTLQPDVKGKPDLHSTTMSIKYDSIFAFSTQLIRLLYFFFFFFIT